MYCVILLLVWIPRILNRTADFLTHQVDIDDYFLTNTTFVVLCRLFQVTPEVDLFASHNNHQLTCSKFVSLYYQPGCHNVDALSLNCTALLYSSHQSANGSPPSFFWKNNTISRPFS